MNQPSCSLPKIMAAQESIFAKHKQKKVTILPLTAILEFESFVLDVNSFSPTQFITRTT